MMPRWFLFAHDRYHPSGGMRDYIGQFTDIQALIDAFKATGRELGDIALLTDNGLVIQAGSPLRCEDYYVNANNVE